MSTDRKKIVANRDNIIARHKKYGFFAQPLVEIELYKNRLVLRYENKDGVHSHTHIADPPFSNSRLLIAHYHEAEANFKTALQDFLPIKRSRLLYPLALIIVNVKEELVDGLLYIEYASLTEAFHATRLFDGGEVCYQDEPVKPRK